MFQICPIQLVERLSTCLSKWSIDSKPDGGCNLKEVRICNITYSFRYKDEIKNVGDSFAIEPINLNLSKMTFLKIHIKSVFL